MNCQHVRSAIDTASKREPYGDPVKTHLNGCPNCRLYADKSTALLALLSVQPRVKAPADFDFKLRARIARAQSEPRTPWAFAERFLTGSFSLGQAATAAATLALVATFTAVHFTNSFTNSGQPAVNNQGASTVAMQTQQIDSPGLKSIENISPVASAQTQAVKTPVIKPGAKNTRVYLMSERPAAAGAAKVQIGVARVARNEVPWRAFNAEKGQMITTPNRPTLIGAETSASSISKTADFVPSI